MAEKLPWGPQGVIVVGVSDPSFLQVERKSLGGKRQRLALIG